MGKSIKGEDGMTKEWIHDTRCPKCGTVNDDGTSVVLGRTGSEKDE